MGITGKTKEIRTLHDKVNGRLHDLTRWKTMDWTRIGGFVIAFIVDIDLCGVDFMIEQMVPGGPPHRKMDVLRLQLDSKHRLIVVSQTATGNAVEPYGTSDAELERMLADVRSILIGYTVGWLNANEAVPKESVNDLLKKTHIWPPTATKV